MTTPPSPPPSIVRALEEASAAQAQGRLTAARKILDDVIAVAPDLAVALNMRGMVSLKGEQDDAAAWFERAIAADPAAPPLWINLATAHRNAGRDAEERRALEGALALDVRDVMANVRLAELLDRTGEPVAAARHWEGVTQIIGGVRERSPAHDALLARAAERVRDSRLAFSDAIDAQLAERRADVAEPTRRRFDACVDAMLGRRRVFHNEPHGVHFPFLPADEFFERRHFPWLAEAEAETGAIRAEVEGLLTADAARFRPYVEMAPGSSDARWTPLDRSLDWSAVYLWKYGVRDDAVCARCPRTAALLDRLPLADMPGRGPTAFFSVLKPRTRLPAHSGISNVRSIVHLPLIVPPGCGFRVGGETRAWREGEAFVFDDTIEHEAWNDSDQVRAVLIFDVWNPHLSEVERAMLRDLFRAVDETGGGAALGQVAD